MAATRASVVRTAPVALAPGGTLAAESLPALVAVEAVAEVTSRAAVTAASAPGAAILEALGTPRRGPTTPVLAAAGVGRWHRTPGRSAELSLAPASAP